MSKKAGSSKSKKFVFRTYTTIGYADAREDKAFLEDCFVNTGALDILQNFSGAECVVTGRTGTGKTALLPINFHIEKRG